MLLQPNNSNNYASMQQLHTQAAILRARLDMMRLDHPDRAALVVEFASLQGQLKLSRNGIERFAAPGSTF
jgi:hypothetical protein